MRVLPEASGLAGLCSEENVFIQRLHGVDLVSDVRLRDRAGLSVSYITTLHQTAETACSAAAQKEAVFCFQGLPSSKGQSVSQSQP